jgi:tellurite resistance protein TerA
MPKGLSSEPTHRLALSHCDAVPSIDFAVLESTTRKSQGIQKLQNRTRVEDMEFSKGQKAKLTELTISPIIEIAIAVSPGPGQTIDISCFGLDAKGKLSDDRFFIFYNQKASPCGSISALGQQQGAQEVFRINLTTLTSTITRLVFAATVDGLDSLSALGPCRLQLLVEGQVCATYAFSGRDFTSEKAVMIAELYQKDTWRLAANGQGFSGGLGPLLAHFGGQEKKSDLPPPSSLAPLIPPPASVFAPASSSKVNLGKVSLNKRGASAPVNLKKGGGAQPIHVNLKWDQPIRKKGFLASLISSPDSADLDLGCMYRLTTGESGVIQALGNSFGSKTHPPFIFLDKDDRSGAAADGENMYIIRPDLVDLIVVFALIYEGSVDFTMVNARVIFRDETGSEIFIPINSPDPGLPFCVTTSIRRDNDASIRISKEERFFRGHKECDDAYGFGFRWVAGHK